MHFMCCLFRDFAVHKQQYVYLYIATVHVHINIIPVCYRTQSHLTDLAVKGIVSQDGVSTETIDVQFRPKQCAAY
jgi:hypothetical protein